MKRLIVIILLLPIILINANGFSPEPGSKGKTEREYWIKILDKNCRSSFGKLEQE